MILEHLMLSIGVGLLWGLVINSGPYVLITERLKAPDPFICALCSGTWVSVILAAVTGHWHPLYIAATPLLSEFVSRWIRS